GLVGSGRSEVARGLVGADRLDAGEVLVDGVPRRVRSPRHAARLGVVMLPESRKEQGLVMVRPVRENETLSALGGLSRLGVVSPGRVRAAARRLPAQVDLR